MIFRDGRLMFESGDKINVEEFGNGMSFVAHPGHKCEKCEFGPICNPNNKGNFIAKFCTETHFLLAEV